MGNLDVTFLGSGDAFGSGGRLQTCMHVDAGSTRFLIDCGTTALIAMRRYGVDPNEIDLIVISHLHGDHFGGLPFLILDGQFGRRTKPMRIAGPPGTRARLDAAMEVFFPGSTKVERKFAVEVTELTDGAETGLGDVRVTPYQVTHPCGAPPFALRMAVAGKTICYSGDTEWTDALIVAARHADLFVAEAYFWDRKVKFHLDFATLWAQREAIGAKRLIVTHMSPDMLGRLAELPCEYAEDGKRFTVS
jgi:ribonuclease BN (tRNA processing enzyme)